MFHMQSLKIYRDMPGYLKIILWLQLCFYYIEIAALHVECYLANVNFYVSTFFFFFAGEFRVAGIYPIFADVTTDLFTAAAVELVNEGVWEPDFKSKSLHIKLASYKGFYFLFFICTLLGYRFWTDHGVPILFCAIFGCSGNSSSLRHHSWSEYGETEQTTNL